MCVVWGEDQRVVGTPSPVEAELQDVSFFASGHDLCDKTVLSAGVSEASFQPLSAPSPHTSRCPRCPFLALLLSVTSHFFTLSLSFPSTPPSAVNLAKHENAGQPLSLKKAAAARNFGRGPQDESPKSALIYTSFCPHTHARACG